MVAAPLHAAAALSVLIASSPHSQGLSYVAALAPTPSAFHPRSFQDWHSPTSKHGRRSSSPSSSSSSALSMNFLSDMLRDAFENDSNLSSDRGLGQLEGPGIEDGRTSDDLTDVQRRFLSSEQAQRRSSTSRNSGEGAPVDPALLVGTKWTLDLYLAGIPERDPSNDLYGQRINISNRDRSVGIGAQVPEEPTVSVSVELKEGGVCAADPSDFTSGAVEGEWKVSEDNRYVRISMMALGYKRTVQTKGTIQKVFWSDADEVSSKTSTVYSIPPGYVYADIPVGYGLPGQLIMRGKGTLAVEQTSGLLGASSKMVVCGKFEGRMTEEGDKKGEL